ncbi:MAG: GIY-YIG nuclease family protein [Fidelibacterota bacterium]
MYTVYVLKSLDHPFHYIGHSRDVPKRLKIHNQGKVRSTKARRPYKVIYTEDYSTKSEADKCNKKNMLLSLDG